MSKIQTKKSPIKKTSLDNSHVYIRSLLTQKIVLKYDEVNAELFDILESKIKKFNEGKCIKEGYVKNNTVKLLTYSSGELFDNKILFECVFECLITNPVESMLIYCITKSITKVGVRAELIVDDENSPYIIFIARDHHYNNESFSHIKENDIIQVRILGQRYELNDKFISIIAELISINNYSTLKNELETKDSEENLEKTGGKTSGNKIKITVKKSTAKLLNKYTENTN
jgi:DNA-directed RNA polymerase subunit E'/Rpb7